MTIRVNAHATDALMQLSELTINEMLVLMALQKFGKVQAHVLAEELESEMTLTEVKKHLDRLNQLGKAKRLEHLRLGTVWKAA